MPPDPPRRAPKIFLALPTSKNFWGQPAILPDKNPGSAPVTPWAPTKALLYVAELIAPWEPLHFTTFKNSILVEKTDNSKTAWINSCSSTRKSKEFAL